MKTSFSPAARMLAFTLALMAGSSSHADETRTTVRVTTVPAAKAMVEVALTAPAEVIGLNNGTLSAQLAAQVETIHVRVGDEVKRGDPLVQLDCRAASENLNIAQAALTLADKAARRARSLSSSNNIAEQNLNEADAGLKRAKAEASLAAIQVEHCLVKAPFDGVVTRRLISVGELADKGKALLTLTDHRELEISARLHPSQISALADTGDLRFVSDGIESGVSLRAITPVIDPQSHTQEARLMFTANSQAAGSRGRLQWSVPGHYLDPGFVQERNGVLGYFVVENDSARFIALPSARLGAPVALAAEEIRDIINEGRHTLTDGSAITIVGAD